MLMSNALFAFSFTIMAIPFVSNRVCGMFGDNLVMWSSPVGTGIGRMVTMKQPYSPSDNCSTFKVICIWTKISSICPIYSLSANKKSVLIVWSHAVQLHHQTTTKYLYYNSNRIEFELYQLRAQLNRPSTETISHSHTVIATKKTNIYLMSTIETFCCAVNADIPNCN